MVKLITFIVFWIMIPFAIAFGGAYLGATKAISDFKEDAGQ